jgi:NADH-quinone oxidoreductase subunit G
MARIIVDGREHEVAAGGNLLQTCLGLGYNIPYFCWHPALGSIGACRQCAVKVFKDAEDAKGRVVMSCMEVVTDGLRLSIEDPEARAFRASVIEWLMTNHPQDCPVCDEGGECHLQDMTVMTGHADRRFRFKKRTFVNQDLGPFVNHELNRCIQCYRCTRFYNEYARDTDFSVRGAHNHLYFGRLADGPLESEFSGNLVEFCPTGVFTDKTLKGHYARKWDLTTAPSVCVHCGLGCNTIPGQRYGELRRIRNRYNGEINRYFLCDRGRYGYEFVNGPARITVPRAAAGEPGAGRTISGEEAVGWVAALLATGKRVVGVGSPRASVESNFLLKKLVGPENFVLGISDDEAESALLALEILRRRTAPPASLADIEHADGALVLGEDLTNTAPLVDLALRQAGLNKPKRIAPELKVPEWQNDAVRTLIQDDRGPLFVATPAPTKLDRFTAEALRRAPADIARLGRAIARAIDPGSAEVKDLDQDDRAAAQRIADALAACEKPLIVGGLSGGDPDILRAAEAVAAALEKKGRPVRMCLTFPECNTLGLILLGGRRSAELLGAEGETLDGLIILENDLFRRMPEDAARALLVRCRAVVAIDHVATRTTKAATVVLPAATFAEATGTLVNNEGRAQRSFRVMVAPGSIRESRSWLWDIGRTAARAGFEPLSDFATLLAAIERETPDLGGVAKASPPPDFRIHDRKVPRAPHRYSGRTAENADLNVSEPKPPDDPDSPLSFTMEGYAELPPSSLISRYWRPGWNSCQALNKFQQEINGPLIGGDPGVRLIRPSGQTAAASRAVPSAFHPEKDRLFLVPLYHIFGSEELSRLGPGVGSLSPKPYVLMNENEATERGFTAGRDLRLEHQGRTFVLPLRTSAGLARGLAGVPAGLPELPGPALRGWAKVSEVGP